jgi:uncharacterized OB-fold protein
MTLRRPDAEHRPAPPTDGLAGQYFAWHRDRELRLQRCDDCRTWIHPPQHSCGSCGGDSFSWQPASGHGTIFTWAVTHRPFHPAFSDETPYICAIITLDEGPRVLSMLRDIADDAVVDGLPVSVEFELREGDSLVAIFVPTDRKAPT